MRRHAVSAVAIALAAGLLAACGGGDDGGSGDGDGLSGGDEELTPVSGGELVYGLEAENSNGWCLTEGQLDVSGIMVARAIYDTLTVPNEDGEYVGYLAESVEPNDDYTEWTVVLRDGITFHDGTPLDAAVVKNNLDAYRGLYPGRSALLFQFFLQPISSVDVVDDTTLTITTAEPWPSLPAFLYSTGRFGIMAQAQLDDPDTCDTRLIGTGPFVLEDWTVNDRLVATRNPDYWRTDAEGNQLPYLDRVVFRPVVESSARTNALLGGELDATHVSNAQNTLVLEDQAASGSIRLEQSSEYAEVAYGLLNASRPPFDDPVAREAAALALDRDALNELINSGIFEVASGPFARGEPGYLEDAGWPDPDPQRAAELAREYAERTGNPLEFTLTLVNTPETIQVGQFLQEQAAAAGVEVTLEPLEQATLISRAIAGDFQSLTFRNHPGGGPDTQYVWWHSDVPTNFGRIDDPEIDALLEEGRVTADRDRQREIYEELNREFAREKYNLWLTWTQWSIGTATDVRGILGSELPDGSGPFPGLADGHELAGAWRTGQ